MIKIMGNQIELLASLGKRLRLLREDRELTQTGIAAMLSSYGVDITPSHLSLVEKNKRNPSVELLVGLAKLLETSTDYLLMMTDDPSPTGSAGNGSIAPMYISEEADDIARIMDSLPPETRRMILAAVRAWLQHERQRVADEWSSLLSVVEQSVGREKRREIESALLRSGTLPAVLTRADNF